MASTYIDPTKATEFVGAASGNPWISPLISAGASILGNIFGFASNDSTNKANERINERNIAASKEMQEANFQFQRDMFDKTNQWNSPEHQAELYRAAGLNPLAMMTNGQSFQPAQQQTGGSQGVPSSIPMQSYQPNFSGISDAVNSYFNNRYQQEQINALRFDNDARSTRFRLEVAEKYADLASKKVKTAQDYKTLELLARELKLFDDTYESKVRQSEADARVSEESANKLVQDQQINALMASLDSQLKQANIRISEKEYYKIQAEVSRIYSEIAINEETRRLTHNEADKARLAVREQFLRNTGVSYDNQLKRQQWLQGKPVTTRAMYEQQSYDKNWKTEVFLDNLKRVYNRIIPPLLK